MHAYKRLVLINLVTLFFSRNTFAAEGMPQFNSETFPSQLFWLIVTFVLLYICMNFVVLPRIRDNLRLRKNKISNDIERAELIKEQVNKTMHEYEAKLLQAKTQADQNTKNAIEKANKDFSLQLASVRKNIIKKIKEAEDGVKDYKANLEKEISNVSLSISSSIVSKVIGESLSKNEIEKLNKDSLKEEKI